MYKLTIAIAVALWMFMGFFFYSGWIAIWGSGVASITVFCLLWSCGLLAFTENPQPSTMEHDA